MPEAERARYAAAWPADAEPELLFGPALDAFDHLHAAEVCSTTRRMDRLNSAAAQDISRVINPLSPCTSPSSASA